jgi:hypothetical protein
MLLIGFAPWCSTPGVNCERRHQTKSMTLEAVEFIRRFLLHILPAGFVKIRHFGFLANRNRSSSLALCRQHLNASSLDHMDFSADNRLCLQKNQKYERGQKHLSWLVY